MKWGDILVNKKKAQKKRGKVLYVYHALKYLFLIRKRVICQEVICLSLWFHHISSVFTLFSMHEDPSSLQPHYFSLHLIQDALNGAFLKMTDTRRLWTSIKQMVACFWPSRPAPYCLHSEETVNLHSTVSSIILFPFPFLLLFFPLR